MHYTDGQYHVSGQFSDDGGGIGIGTQLEEDWLNAVQNELMNWLETAGIAGVKGTHTQLLSAYKHPTIFKPFLTDVGSVNALHVNPSPEITALGSAKDGMLIRVKAAYANTGACTLQVNSLTAKGIKGFDGSDLSADMILQYMICDMVYVYNGGTDYFALVNIAMPSWIPTEILAARGSEASLNARLSNGLDADGHLKESGNHGLVKCWAHFYFNGTTQTLVTLASHGCTVSMDGGWGTGRVKVTYTDGLFSQYPVIMGTCEPEGYDHFYPEFVNDFSTAYCVVRYYDPHHDHVPSPSSGTNVIATVAVLGITGT